MTEKDIKDENNNSSKTLEKGAIFLDPHTFFVFKKIEKITTALYAITELMEDREPFKWSIRNSANGLIQNVVLLTKRSLGGKAKNLRELNRSLLETGSYLEISEKSGLISEMNFRIINDEVRKISYEIEKVIKGQEKAEQKVIEDTLGKGNNSHKGHLYKGQDVLNKQKDINNVLDKEHVDDIKKTSPESFGINLNLRTKDTKDTKDNTFDNNREKVVEKALVKEVEKTAQKPVSSSKKRLAQIVSLLEENEDLMIKDISLQIGDVSEKTIQRDLVKLINKGLVKKEGERRWSRYSLAK